MSSIETTLIESVKQIAPIVRAHSQEAEQERHLSSETVKAMIKAGLFRMFIPKSLGGLEVDPITCARVIEELSVVDSAAGWGLSNPVSYTHWCARLPDEGPVEMFGENPDVIIAGPFHPPLKALPADAGYRISGRAPLASNCREASWIAATAMVMDGDQPKKSDVGEPEVRMIFLRAQDCEIIDT